MSILFSSALTLTLALCEFVQLAALSVLARLPSYSSVCTALPVLRRRSNLAPPKVRVRFGPFVSAAALLLCTWLLSNSSWREVRAAAIAGIIGFLIYGGYKMVKSFWEFD